MQSKPSRGRPSPAMVVALIALFVALSGSAYATIDRKIGTKDLKKGAVSTKKLKKQAVGTGKIKPQAVKRGKIADGAVSTPKILDGAVITDKLGDEAVTTQKIANLAVGTLKLADDAVTTTKIADQAVTTAKLAEEAVSTTKVAAGAITSPKVGTIVKRVGSVQVLNNANGTANAACLAGERLLSGGGGFLGGEMNAQVSFSGQVGAATNWRVHGRNESGATRTLEAQVHCLQ